MSNPLLHDTLDILRAHGIKPVVENGIHLKLRFTNKFGANCMLIISRTPSRRSAVRQNRGQLQRLLRMPARTMSTARE